MLSELEADIFKSTEALKTRRAAVQEEKKAADAVKLELVQIQTMDDSMGGYFYGRSGKKGIQYPARVCSSCDGSGFSSLRHKRTSKNVLFGSLAAPLNFKQRSLQRSNEWLDSYI